VQIDGSLVSRPVAPTEVGATIGFMALLAIVACGQEPATPAVATEWCGSVVASRADVCVDDDVRLEVLDWGGTGRAVVLRQSAPVWVRRPTPR
jgi:hypothetical protein